MDQNQILGQMEEEQRQRDTATNDIPDTNSRDEDGFDFILQEHYDNPADLPDEIFEQEDVEIPIENSGTNEFIDSIPEPEATELEPTKQVSDAEENVTFEPPEQDELNEIVTDVTALGLDEEVLGREGLLEAIREAEDTEASGGSYVDGFTSSIERQLFDRNVDPVETEQSKVEASPPSEQEMAFERYTHHKNELVASRESGGSWQRDSIDAYHRMGMTYNAYVAGEKIDGLPVSKVDVFLSGVRFYQSNIFETAIIRAVKFACNALGDKNEGKVETEQNLANKDSVDVKMPLRDTNGAFDTGDATAASTEQVKQARESIKEYGLDYGLDTTKGLSYNSADNLQIYQPTDYVAKIDIGNGKTFNAPGIRMVDIDGNRALISPDGKVVHESEKNERPFSDGDKSRIESRCDAFESRSVKDQFSQMAESRGISTEELKGQYAERAMDAYASRIEGQMLSEANRLEQTTIPEARNELNSLREDFSKLDKIEMAITHDGIDSRDIQDLKVELNNGIEKLENRISAMEDRVELLRDVQSQVSDSTIEDRFSRSATTEDHAVGRAGNIEYIDNSTNEKIINAVDSGTEKVIADVEKFNAANPESAVSYDADKGELYNKFGVSESGKYDVERSTVDKSELPSDNPDSIGEHISKHIDTDFDKYREFEPDRPDVQNDVDAAQPDAEAFQTDPVPEVEQLVQSEVETPPEPDTQETVSNVEQPAQQDSEVSAEIPEPVETDAVERSPAEVETVVEVPEDDGTGSDVDDSTEENIEADLADAVDESELATDSVDRDDSKSEIEANAEDETEAKVAAAHDDDANSPNTAKPEDDTTIEETDLEPLAQPEEIPDAEIGDADMSDKVHEILDAYFNDTEGLIAPEDDVVRPILELFENYGQSDFKDIFDSISEVMAGQEDIEDSIGKFTDLVEGFIDVYPDSGEGYDMFSQSMLEAGVPSEISETALDNMLSLEMISTPLDVDVEAQVTIGDQDLTILDSGIFDTYSDEPLGGFLEDQAADRFFEQADQALYDAGTGVELPDMGMETSTPFDTESLVPDFETIQPPEVSTGDDLGFDTSMPETAVDIPGGIEGIEAAEAGAAVEGIEAAAAALL